MKKTAEELMALAKEDGVNLSQEQANELAKQELSDEDVKMISGGEVADVDLCPSGKSRYCKFKKTGNTRPGMLWGLNWEVKCIYCGKTEWRRFEPDE